MKISYQSALLLFLLSNSAISQAEINAQALLDLVTCYGADFPPEEFNKTADKDPRLIRMEKTLASITKRQGLKPAEVSGFDQPDPPLQLLSFPIHFIGMEGYGPFSGINLSVGGNFKAIKDAVEQQQAIQYKHCKEKPNMHLQTCNQDVTNRYSRLILTHPNDPLRQVILICVNKHPKQQRQHKEKASSK